MRDKLGVSERRACRVLGQHRSTQRHIPKGRADEDRLVADLVNDLRDAALGQAYVAEAPVCLVITMNVARSGRKYGERAERYCLMEAGHIAQNVLLQATALGLGGVPVGAFDEERVAAILSMPKGREPVYLLPVGKPAES